MVDADRDEHQSPSGRFSFEGSTGAPLAGRLDLPAAEPVAVAVFAHCFTCSQDAVAAARIGRGLVAAGIAVLRFDFTGLGSSGGDFANTNFSSNVDDLVAATAAVRSRVAAPPILVGHSLGGAAVLAAADRLPEVVAVVTVNAPADPGHVAGLLPPEAREALGGEAEEVTVSIAGRTFPIRRQFLDDVSSVQLEAVVGSLGRPLLVLHSPTDQVVGIDHARRIYDAARHPKSFVSLDGADHLLTGPGDGAYVADVTAAWLRRYLPGRQTVPDPEWPVAEGEVRVAESHAGRLQQHVRAGRHSLVADEPAGVGDGAGPTPYDLLLAALGTCTSMTLRMYAERKGWPLDHIAVRLRHHRRHAEDCAECDSSTGTVDLIERDLELAGALSEEQLARLVEIAERCPVHRTLTSETRMVTRRVGPGGGEG